MTRNRVEGLQKKKKEREPGYEPRELLEGIQVCYVTTKSRRLLAKYSSLYVRLSPFLLLKYEGVGGNGVIFPAIIIFSSKLK